MIPSSVQLTYNYTVGSYKRGTDLQGITVQSREALGRARAAGWPVLREEGRHVLQAPGGYKVYVTQFVLSEEFTGWMDGWIIGL